MDVNLFSAPDEMLRGLEALPYTLGEAEELARQSELIRRCMPELLG